MINKFYKIGGHIIKSEKSELMNLFNSDSPLFVNKNSLKEKDVLKIIECIELLKLNKTNSNYKDYLILYSFFDDVINYYDILFKYEDFERIIKILINLSQTESEEERIINLIANWLTELIESYSPIKDNIEIIKYNYQDILKYVFDLVIKNSNTEFTKYALEEILDVYFKENFNIKKLYEDYEYENYIKTFNLIENYLKEFPNDNNLKYIYLNMFSKYELNILDPYYNKIIFNKYDDKYSFLKYGKVGIRDGACVDIAFTFISYANKKVFNKRVDYLAWELFILIFNDLSKNTDLADIQINTIKKSFETFCFENNELINKENISRLVNKLIEKLNLTLTDNYENNRKKFSDIFKFLSILKIDNFIDLETIENNKKLKVLLFEEKLNNKNLNGE